MRNIFLVTNYELLILFYNIYSYRESRQGEGQRKSSHCGYNCQVGHCRWSTECSAGPQVNSKDNDCVKAEGSSSGVARYDDLKSDRAHQPGSLNW